MATWIRAQSMILKPVQKITPIYNPQLSYRENFEKGPFFSEKIPSRIKPPQEKWFDFLGQKIASRIGVPAGPLLNSHWTTLASQLGFDVVTYKTIRTKYFSGHPLPNIVYVSDKMLTENDLHSTLVENNEQTINFQNFGITNSFGMPSQDPEFIVKDIAQAKDTLATGQVLVVSVVGTPDPKIDFTDDFVKSAMLAKSAGATIVEANFSCPNVCTGEGSIYTNIDTLSQIGKRLVAVLGDTPLIIKIGYIENQDLLKKILLTSARIGIRAVSGLNSVALNVTNKFGEPALGPNRLKSGVCGAPIRQLAINFVQKTRNYIDKQHLPLTLIGVGGVTAPEHFRDLLNAGADVAMSATGMMWNPLLASEYHQKYE